MLKYELIDSGKEEWVVFIHGIGGSTKTWKKQIDSFSDKYNLLLLDLPGHGLNSKNIIKKVNSDLLHNGIKETLDYLNIESAHFIGMSLGTIIIANFAIRNPSYIKSIIFGGSVLQICGIYKFCMVAANAIKRVVPYKWLYEFFAWFLLPRKNHAKSRRIFVREVMKLDKETMFSWISYLRLGLNPKKIIDKLDGLGKKMLFISGDEDHCFLKGAKILANKLKKADLKIIKHCGHVCSIERYVEFNKIALNYLATI